MHLKLPKSWQRSELNFSQISTQFQERIGRLKLGRKLNLSFGTLAFLTFFVVGRTYFSSAQATYQMAQTQKVRIPSALTSSKAQEDLLKMLSDLRGYLATGESSFRDRYQQHRQTFEDNLVRLDELQQQSTGKSQQQLQTLKTTYQEWLKYPDQLFHLRDNTLDNQPALKMLEQEGEIVIGSITNNSQQMLESQEARPPSMENSQLLKHIVDFNSSFSLLTSAVQNYLITRDPAFRFEYGSSLKANQEAWEKLNQSKDLLSATQQIQLEQISRDRQALLMLPGNLFEVVESDRYRQDLYLLQSQVEPLASTMLGLLDQIVTDQQAALTQELEASNDHLTTAQWQNLLTGLAAVGLGTSMAIFFKRQIANPIQRLTDVTTRVTAGDFEVNAPVESQDEIGTLAITFNHMIQSLKESRENLEAYNRNLEQKVESRTETLQKAFEDLKQAQTQLVQTEKMSSLGQMVAGIAHEINNPVNFIHGNIGYTKQYAHELLELLHLYQVRYPETDSEIQAKMAAIDLPFLKKDMDNILASIQVGTERIREIVKSLRIFSRLDESEVKNVDIHEGIDSTLMILQSRLKESGSRLKIEVIKQYGELPKIECYAGQLNQVFMNILSNGIDVLEDAIKEHAQKEHIQNNSSDSDHLWVPTIRIQTEAVKNTHVTIRLTDNGLGMTEEVKKRLFDPFFTTKEVGKGTGLGMSISHQIITEKHQGTIECISELGKGAEFLITIPVEQSSSNTKL